MKECENCKFHRSQSWCAKALPDYKGYTDLEKIRMEGFWEALDWAEEHYKWMEDHYDKTNDYIVAMEKLIDLCYVDERAPTEKEVTIIDNFWNGD